MKSQRVTRGSPTENPLDRPLTITIFHDAKARTKREHRVSLRELADRIPNRTARTKAELRLLKLAKFGEEKTTKGSLRSNANLLSIEGVEGDYDGEQLSVEEAAAKLRDAGLAALIYTSPSHRPEKPRWRVICPTSRPLPPAARESLMARVNGVLGGALAGESFILSQTYFYGHAERVEINKEEWIEGCPVDVRLIEGRPVDLADDLDAGALDKDGKPYGAVAETDEEYDDEFPALEPDVERISKALDSIPGEKWDQRELWLSIGQALHHEFNGGEEGFELWDEASQSSGKYDADDQRRVWESFGPFVGKPVTIGTLYRLAKELSRKAEPLDGELRFLTTEECAAAPWRGYVVKGLLAPGDVGCIFGAPGAGKSVIAPHFGYQVALGETAFGMRTKAGVVFYVAAEDPHGMKERVAALAIRQGHARLFRVVEGVSDLYSEDSPDLAALVEAIEEERPALIIIDTLARAFPGLEENDSKSMGRVVAVARQLAEHRAGVVLIHHDTKAEGSTPRGHSSLNGDLDVALHLKRDNDGTVRAELTKNRNGTPDRDIAFKIATEVLGTDEDGDAITAPLVEELTGRDAARPKRLPPSQREALAVLEELEGNGTVSNDEWADTCTEGLRVSQSEHRKLRRDAFSRARRALVEAGLIQFDANGNVRAKRQWEDEVTSEEDDE